MYLSRLLQVPRSGQAPFAMRPGGGTSSPPKGGESGWAPGPCSSLPPQGVASNRLFAPPKGGESLPGIGFLTGLSDLPEAFALLTRSGGPWKSMVDSMERLRQERIDRQDTGSGGEAFSIGFSADGTWCERSRYQDRRRELADRINLQPGQSVFGLIHELTHALPLEVLPPELASVPYTTLKEIGKEPTFEEIYHHTLHCMYQDESISCLAEILLYRDLKKAGYGLTRLEHPSTLNGLQKGLEIYEKEGLTGYLRSEIYIGRNHRSSYSDARAMELAMMATFNPTLLGDPSALHVLEEHGMTVTGATKLKAALAQAQGLLGEPTPEKVVSFVESLISSGADLKVDLDRVGEVLREAIALRTGDRRKASASFLGRREEVVHQVQMAASALLVRGDQPLGNEQSPPVFLGDPDETEDSLLGDLLSSSVELKAACITNPERLKNRNLTSQTDKFLSEKLLSYPITLGLIRQGKKTN